MSEIVFAGALSHAPLLNYEPQGDHEQIGRFHDWVKELGEALRRSRPDVLVLIAPDHFRTYFYDLMPQFVLTIGKFDAWGDWRTAQGPFEGSAPLSGHIARQVIQTGFDLAISYAGKVDHGTVQPLQMLSAMELPIVSITINSSAPPLPTPARCWSFGQAVGQAIRSFPDAARVAILGSGGLSHAPPVPDPDSPDPEEREKAVHGKALGFASSIDRETRLLSMVDQFSARINPAWDRMVLDYFESGRVGELAQRLSYESIERDAGNGGQEIRQWLACAGAAGPEPFRVLGYEPIRTLITGMGLVLREFPETLT